MARYLAVPADDGTALDFNECSNTRLGSDPAAIQVDQVRMVNDDAFFEHHTGGNHLAIPKIESRSVRLLKQQGDRHRRAFGVVPGSPYFRRSYTSSQPCMSGVPSQCLPARRLNSLPQRHVVRQGAVESDGDLTAD